MRVQSPNWPCQNRPGDASPWFYHGVPGLFHGNEEVFKRVHRPEKPANLGKLNDVGDA